MFLEMELYDIVGIARFEAEEKIKARERMHIGENQYASSPTPLVEEAKGESIAIIAQKAGVSIQPQIIALLPPIPPRLSYVVSLDGSLPPRSDNPSRKVKVDSGALQKLISVALWK